MSVTCVMERGNLIAWEDNGLVRGFLLGRVYFDYTLPIPCEALTELVGLVILILAAKSYVKRHSD